MGQKRAKKDLKRRQKKKSLRTAIGNARRLTGAQRTTAQQLKTVRKKIRRLKDENDALEDTLEAATEQLTDLGASGPYTHVLPNGESFTWIYEQGQTWEGACDTAVKSGVPRAALPKPSTKTDGVGFYPDRDGLTWPVAVRTGGVDPATGDVLNIDVAVSRLYPEHVLEAFGKTYNELIRARLATREGEGTVIRIFKSGREMAVQTDADSEDVFIEEASRALTTMIADATLVERTEWEAFLRKMLHQTVDISCKYRGYKTRVVTRQIHTTGDITLAATSTPLVVEGQEGVAIVTDEDELAAPPTSY